VGPEGKASQRIPLVGFLFMNGLANKPAAKTKGEYMLTSPSRPLAADTLDSLTVEENEAIRALFDLLATWDREAGGN
jgi:hypothetical protein